MSVNNSDNVPHIYLSDLAMDEPCEAELKLVLQFLPDIYHEMIMISSTEQE